MSDDQYNGLVALLTANQQATMTQLQEMAAVLMTILHVAEVGACIGVVVGGVLIGLARPRAVVEGSS